MQLLKQPIMPKQKRYDFHALLAITCASWAVDHGLESNTDLPPDWTRLSLLRLSWQARDTRQTQGQGSGYDEAQPFMAPRFHGSPNSSQISAPHHAGHGISSRAPTPLSTLHSNLPALAWEED